MGMDLDDLRDQLRHARDCMSSASTYMGDAKSNANYAESEADDAYSKIDDIIDNLDAYLAIDVDQHRTILALNQKLVKILAYVNVLLKDGATGDGVSSDVEHRLYSIGNILGTLFMFDEDNSVVTGLNDHYEFGYQYSNYSWIITKKEENNG
jgi:hypothetical protein